MKLLTATSEQQGDRDGDFCYAVEGELVLLGQVCVDDEKNPDGACGCGRAFSGMSSMTATTTAMVRDLDVSLDDLQLAIEGYFHSAGMGPDVIGRRDFAGLVSDTLGQIVGTALSLPTGAVIGRRLDRVVRRSMVSEQ